MSPKGRRICCCTVLLLIAIIVAVCVSLFLTILKPKAPVIIPHPSRLSNVTVAVFPAPSLNATLNLTITVKNPNYGDCWYQDSTAQVYYRGNPVAELPLEHGAVPARGQSDMVALAEFSGGKVVNVPGFFADITAGSLNFTSVADMPVKVKVLKTLKFNVKVIVNCNMSILVSNQSYDVLSTCSSKLKI